ncbi:hypothetical protein CUJ83_12375 [Methanocella sp. CWC-04]|uniref:4Fe-4S ferredoxin-type domain-containing protein n=1 Tax=Methanooceanicella nereidis TaxID=2052831 RepID=A0AAP2REB3_9EURY|nr:4Fe-4S dicluster domain-containing protein [Methanocella sp. CWC-04]MCD1295794.1 hypothetical protein [Methanocella sp. CWC-04]
MKMSSIFGLIKRISGNNDVNGIDSLLEKYDATLYENSANPIVSGIHSKKRHTFMNEKMMMLNIPLSKLMRLLQALIKVQLSFRKAIDYARSQTNSNKTEVDGSFQKTLENKAKNWGALDIAYIRIPDEFIFKGKSIPYKNAIVITGEMDKENILTAPSVDCMIEVQKTYGNTGVIVNKITKFLRSNGYNAVPCHSLGGVVDYPALAQRAGMGALGRHGLLISKANGASQRIAVVFTDIENFQNTPGEDYSWVEEYCTTCGRCIKNCKVGAIYEKKVIDESGQYTTTDGDKCLEYFSTHYGCSICIKVCPFTKAGYDKLKKAYQRAKYNT